MDVNSVKGLLEEICAVITGNKDYLVQLDQQNGDGDLGVSMSDGYLAVVKYARATDEKDLGKFFMQCGKEFNEAAPSSLGTISAFCFMGIAKALKGKEEAAFEEAAMAMMAGVENIMAKAGSKPGEKTILDSLYPGAKALVDNGADPSGAVAAAAAAAADGSEATRQMRSVHGRAAYYGDKSIGVLDGGSVVGKLIFEGIANYYRNAATEYVVSGRRLNK